MNAVRNVVRVIKSHKQEEGGGFIVRRPFPSRDVIQVDPFLLLDEMGPTNYAPGEAIGAPDHPHRGFETVTYILDGEMEHEDSAGHKGKIAAGDVQWMTAGRGVVHSELPSARVMREGARMHGFQIWVNLPARDKMMEPRYQEISSAKLPTAESDDKRARVRIIAGEALGKSAAIETRTPIVLQDWTLQPGANVDVRVPENFDASIYVFENGATISGKEIVEGDFAVLGPGENVRFERNSAAKTHGRFLLLGGVPIQEPVARYGPFVMNTEREIREAITDYQAGRLGAIAR